MKNQPNKTMRAYLKFERWCFIFTATVIVGIFLIALLQTATNNVRY